MIPEAMEERLAKEWGLTTSGDIRQKIFENYSDGDKLTELLESEKLIVCSYALGQILASFDVNLKASQLRRFYESLLQIKGMNTNIKGLPNFETAFRTRILPNVLMLKPLLANTKARQGKQLAPFFDVINLLFDVIKDSEDLERLCNFVQAIGAYHKYCGGRD